MSLADGGVLAQGSSKLSLVRTTVAEFRDRLFVKAGKLWTLLISPPGKKILFSEKPDWETSIRNGFHRLPHEVEFGPITSESFKNFDLVVPLTLGALDTARRCCPEEKSAYPLPPAEIVRLCDDKYAFNKTLIEAGFSRIIPPMVQGLGLERPYILKKRSGSWGQDCYVIRSEEDEQKHLSLIQDPNYFCQHLVPGSAEFATHILFKNGRILKALNVRYEFSTDLPIKGQDPALVQVICRCRYLDLWTKVLQHIRFEGLCCVNYKIANGEPFLLEINPRFGGSLKSYFFMFVKHLGC